MDLEEAFRKLSKKEFEQIMFENACATVENQEKLNILNGLYGKLKINPKAIHPGTSDKLLIRKAVKEYSNKYEHTNILTKP